jgi:hypothetical protein
MDLTQDLVRRFMLSVNDLLSSEEKIVGLYYIH